MQSRNKVVVMGLVAGAVTWNFTRQLPYGIEAGALAGWAALLPDLDSAYEFAGDHSKYPPATLAVPFGRNVADRLHSWGRIKFLHSVFGFSAFMALGELLTLLHRGSYAGMELIVETWIIFAVARYLFLTILRHPLREIIRVTLVYLAAVAAGMWEFWYGHAPGYASLPPHWFTLALAIGVGGNILTELLSARGIPVLWPIPWDLKIPLLGETGGLREGRAMLFFLIAWTIWWWDHYPSFHGIVIAFIPSVIVLVVKAQQFIVRMLSK